MDKKTRYVNNLIYSLPESEIDQEVCGDYIDFLNQTDRCYLDDILSECSAYDIKKSIAIFGVENMPDSELVEMEKLINSKIKEDIMMRINDIREIEESEPDDHGMTNKDFLVGGI